MILLPNKAIYRKLPQLRARRKKKYPGSSAFSCVPSQSLGPPNCLLQLSGPQNCRQPQGDTYTVPGVGWPSLSFWVLEESLCLGPFILDKHALWVSDYPVPMKRLVCGGNLLIGFLSGFFKM